MNTVKVLHIITRLDVGGSSTNTIETVARLDKRKFETVLIFGKTRDPGGKIEESLKQKNISYQKLDNLVRPVNPLCDIIAFWQLWTIMRKENFAIVHTHSSKAGLIGRWAAKCAGVKHIAHTPHGHVFYGYFNKAVTAVFIFLEQITAKITDKIITLTQKGKADHIHFRIAPENKFVPIYSGIDVDSFKKNPPDLTALRKQFGVSEQNIVFGAVARLDPIKGNLDLLKAFEKVSSELLDAKLILVGDGSQRETLQNFIQARQWTNRVYLAGHQEDVKAYLYLFDIFVLASLNEGMGRVILEAMACARPVVATRVGGIPEMISEHQTGLLVNSQSPRELADAMLRLAKSVEQRKEMGLNAQQSVTDKFSLDTMVGHIAQLYEKLLES